MEFPRIKIHTHPKLSEIITHPDFAVKNVQELTLAGGEGWGSRGVWTSPLAPSSRHHCCPAQAQEARPGEGPRSSAKLFWPSLAPRWAGLLDRAAARWHAAPQAEATLIDGSCLAPPPPLQYGNRKLPHQKGTDNLANRAIL